MKLVNVEVAYPKYCPFRYKSGFGNICRKLSHDEWVFKCERDICFPDECPLSEFGFLISDSGIKAAVNTLKKYCGMRLDSGYRCDENCPLSGVCKSDKKFSQMGELQA